MNAPPPAGQAASRPRQRRGLWRRRGAQSQDPAVEERYEKLRAWRKQRAEARKVEVQVIAPNAVLLAIAKAAPQTLETLGAVEGMDTFRIDQYGAEMLSAANAPSALATAPAAGERRSETATDAVAVDPPDGRDAKKAAPVQIKLF